MYTLTSKRGKAVLPLAERKEHMLQLHYLRAWAEESYFQRLFDRARAHFAKVHQRKNLMEWLRVAVPNRPFAVTIQRYMRGCLARAWLKPLIRKSKERRLQREEEERQHEVEAKAKEERRVKALLAAAQGGGDDDDEGEGFDV